MPKSSFLLVPLVALSLNGCVGAVVEGGSVAKDMTMREALEKSAKAGSAEAQLKLGETYCCRVGLKMGVYDNEQATAWMCKAAHQGYGPAALRLAEIYSGRPFTYRLMRRVISAVKGAPKNMPVALTWAKLAQSDGDGHARALLKRLNKDATAAERRSAVEMQKRADVPCNWNDVIGAS